MRNLNRVTMIGQLTADPESKTLKSGQSMSTGSIATNYSWKDDQGQWKSGVDYHKVVAWQRMAELMQQFKKGDQLVVEGKLRSRSWTTEDGTKRYVTEIIVNRLGGVVPTHSKSNTPDQDTAEELETIPFLDDEEQS